MGSLTRKQTSDTGSPGAPARSARSRLTGLLAGAALTAVLASGCQIPVEQWVPDLDDNGTISQAEVDRQSQVVVAAVTRAVEAQRRSVQAHPFLACVRHHESDPGGWPHTGGYTAQNARSSASGAYQFIDSTWRTVSARAGYPGYSRALQAPWWVQDAVALHTIEHGGRSHWNGTGC